MKNIKKKKKTFQFQEEKKRTNDRIRTNSH